MSISSLRGYWHWDVITNSRYQYALALICWLNESNTSHMGHFAESVRASRNVALWGEQRTVDCNSQPQADEAENHDQHNAVSNHSYLFEWVRGWYSSIFISYWAAVFLCLLCVDTDLSSNHVHEQRLIPVFVFRFSEAFVLKLVENSSRFGPIREPVRSRANFFIHFDVERLENKVICPLKEPRSNNLIGRSL